MYHWRFETHIILKILTCLLLLIYAFNLLENLSLKNRFNYILFENSWKHMWIKLLKLALSSNYGPYPKHGGNVSNLKKHNP
jgi:hypothetical protein